MVLVTSVGGSIARLTGLAALWSISTPPIASWLRATVLAWQCVCVCCVIGSVLYRHLQVAIPMGVNPDIVFMAQTPRKK